MQFAAIGLAAMLVIGLIGVTVIRNIGTHEAIRNAEQLTQLAGNGIVAPNVTAGVLRGEPTALARLDAIVRRRVLDDQIVRVKLWTADGRVVYSDEHRLIGSTYPRGADELAALKGDGAQAEVSDLSRPENRFERSYGKLLEVYLPLPGPDGRPLLFEAYQQFSSVSASGRRLWRAFAPALAGGLLLLWLVTLPLAWSMARRLREGQRQREALLQRALDASGNERRRIASDLHDGVVQDLVGVSYGLSLDAEQLDGDEAARETLRRGAARTRDSIRALRTLLVDIYPPSLQQAGLAAALSDLARTTTARGTPTTLHLPDDLELSADREALLFRCAQEALRNVVTHSGAAHAEVTVAAVGGRVAIEIRDDGRGFDPASVDGGHFGLRVLRDLVNDVDGSFELETAPGRGTRLRAEVPAE
ncbi:MAG TPA: sensor histidine kinase [Solirubrobacteraceae bacterium]